jgi:hypothetical protein
MLLSVQSDFVMRHCPSRAGKENTMTVELFQKTLEAYMSHQPFRAFTIELNTGRRYEIDHPRAAAFQEGAALIFAPGGVPVIFDHESVNQIINSPAHSAPGKRRE